MNASARWMALALGAYARSPTGSVLCRPGAGWQPYAAWHVLSAIGLGGAVLGFAARLPRPAGDPASSPRPLRR